jgi:hypothetical protein
MVQRQHDGDNSDGARRRQWRRPNERWAATTATLWRDGDATATVMDDDGWYNGYTTAMMAMERGGDGDGAQTSNGRHRGNAPEGGGGRWPSNPIHRSPPSSPDRASPPSPTTILPRVLCL